MKILAAVAVLAVCAHSTLAGPTTKAYAKSCDAVFAAEQSVLNAGQYRTIAISKEDKTVSFVAGGWATGERTLSASLAGSGDVCTITVQSRFSGLAHHDAPDFIKRVDAALDGKK